MKSGPNSRALADYKLSPIDTLNFIERIRMTPTLIRNAFYIQQSVKRTKKKPSRSLITDKELVEFKNYATSLGIADIGFIEIEADDIFSGFGVAYPYAIIFTFPIPKEDIISDPCFEKLKMIESTYVDSGMMAMKLTKYLRDKNIGAQPGAGGLTILPVLAERAGMGVFGRHGVLITKEFGPGTRMGLVYTNITNLPSTSHKNDDMGWVKDYCARCGRCIKKCPYGAIYDHPIVTTANNLTHIDLEKCIKQFESKYGCTVCLKVCSFTTIGYEKIHSARLKRGIGSD